MTKTDEMIDKGTLQMYYQVFKSAQMIGTLSPKGMVAFIESKSLIEEQVEKTEKSIKAFIDSLKTKEFKEAEEAASGLKEKENLTEIEKEALFHFEEFEKVANEKLGKYTAELYSVKVKMPVLETISSEDWAKLVADNAPKEMGKPGLYADGAGILRKLIVEHKK